MTTNWTASICFLIIYVPTNEEYKWLPLSYTLISCADPESFVRGGPIFKCFFLCVFCFCFVFSWYGEVGSKFHYHRAIIGPPAKCHLNGVLLGCRWWPNIECWLGSFVIFQGIGNSIAKKPYNFVIFQGGGVSGPPPPPRSLDPCMDIQRKPFA